MSVILQLMALTGLVAVVYGVWHWSTPAAWVTGGLILFLYAEVSLLPKKAPPTEEADE